MSLTHSVVIRLNTFIVFSVDDIIYNMLHYRPSVAE